MRILALDVASATGYAYGDGADKVPTFGTIRLPRASELGEYGPRFAAFRRELLQLIPQSAPEMVWFESPVVHGMIGKTNEHTLRLLIALPAFVEEICHTFRIQCREATSPEMRKHFLGSAHGKRADLKLAMMKQCHLLNWNVGDDNQADACGLWDLARNRLRVQSKLKLASS